MPLKGIGGMARRSPPASPPPPAAAAAPDPTEPENLGRPVRPPLSLLWEGPPPAAPAQGAGKDPFSRVPSFTGSEAVLLRSGRPGDAATLPATATFVRLRVEFPTGPPSADSLDAGLSLLLFVDDLAAPRARVRLADLVRHGGERPLNLRREAGQVVRLVLT